MKRVCARHPKGCDAPFERLLEIPGGPIAPKPFRWRCKFLLVAILVWGLIPTSRPPIVYAQGGNVELVSGWTGPLDFQLLADGTAVNLTGMTVELLLTKTDGTPVDTTGDTSVTDPANGKVRYSPDATDLLVASSPIKMRWKVTDGSGAVVYHPSGRPAAIMVHAV